MKTEEQENIFYKYKSLGNANSFNRVMDSLGKQYLFFAKPSQLDDKFECRIRVNLSDTPDPDINHWKRYRKKYSKKTNDEIRDEFKTNPEFTTLFSSNNSQLDTYRILSLSKTYNNELLWAMYADSFNGICIGYKALSMETENTGQKGLLLYLPEKDADKEALSFFPGCFDDVHKK